MSPFNPRDYTFIRSAVFARSTVSILVLHHQCFASSVHDDVLVLVGKLFPFHVQWDRVFFSNSFEHSLEVLRMG